MVFDHITHDTGHVTIHDSAGDLVLREAGLIEFSYRFDTGGDGEPGGDFILFQEDLRTAGQHPTFAEDFDLWASSTRPRADRLPALTNLHGSSTPAPRFGAVGGRMVKALHYQSKEEP